MTLSILVDYIIVYCITQLMCMTQKIIMPVIVVHYKKRYRPDKLIGLCTLQYTTMPVVILCLN